MSLIVGIDLGTTNSCIAVHADAAFPGREEKIASGLLRPVGDALVITDRYRATTTPSAVWLDPDGTAVVGALAKAKARLSGEPPPAMYFKRDMSGSAARPAGHGELTPEQASAHILRHLKQQAEEVLEVPVDRAVITVPAYFETQAKNATTQAGAAAGLDVVDTLIEPVAAALCYLSTTDLTGADGGLFLVYDLGGGTFDASVVAWDEEGFTPLGSDGDRFLGGYDFDQTLVALLADKRAYYDLKIDTEVAEHRALLHTLLTEVETVKIELSRSPVTELNKSDVLDCSGVPMTLTVPFERAEFEAAISAAVHGTVDGCDAALRQAAGRREGVSPEQLDRIVLVGGSSRIPLVHRLLAERFGQEPVLVEPDLCVAVGAALQSVRAAAPSLHLEVANPVVLDGTGEVNGRVLAGGPVTEAAGQLVVLRSDDGVHTERTRSDSRGGFRFAGIELGEETGFTVALVVDGDEIDSQQVTMAARPAGIDNPGVLANSIVLALRAGRHVVAAAGDAVPCHVEVVLSTRSQGTTLVVPVQEGMVPVGEVTISDLSADLPVGTPVLLSVTVRADWTIEATVRVPEAQREARATMRLRSMDAESWERIESRLLDITSAWAEKRTLVDPRVRMLNGPDIDRAAAEVRALLDRRIDATKATYRLVVLETLVESVPLGRGTKLRPPMPEFEDRLSDLERLCDRMSARDAARAAEFRAEIPSLRTRGEAAYFDENQLDWELAVHAVIARIVSAEEILDPRPGGGAIDPQETRRWLLREVSERLDLLRRTAASLPDAERTRSVLELAGRLESRGRQLEAQVRGIDVEAGEGQQRLDSVYRTEVRPWIAQATDFPPGEIIVGVDGR